MKFSRRSFVVLVVTLAAVLASWAPATASVPEQASKKAKLIKELGGKETYDKLQALYRKAKTAGEDKLVLYGQSATVKPLLFAKFSETFPGITVEGVPLGGSALVARINAEQTSGQRVVDVAEGGNNSVIALSAAKHLTSFTPFAVPLEQLPIDAKSTALDFFGTSQIPFVVVYNTTLVAKKDVPTEWNDLLDPQFKGKIMMFDPGAAAGSPTVEMFARMALTKGLTDFPNKLAKQSVTINPVTNPQGIITAVAQGSMAIGITANIPQIQTAQQSGAPVAPAFMKDGNLFSISYSGIVKGAPHPNVAELWENWSYTPQASTAATKAGLYTITEGNKGPKGLPKLADLANLRPIPLLTLTAANQASIARNKPLFG